MHFFTSLHGARHRLLAPLAGILVAAALLLVPGLARADSGSQLTVVGTSDVSDSGLIPNLIQPEFQQAFPQFTFKYVGTASGTAIIDAQTGVNAPSVLIVHAPSLENTFVSGGFSQEAFGRSIWTNDFVLAGPQKNDVAGVAANDPHDIVRAFAAVANAGVNGGGAPADTFVSRGGTPGTTTAEHGIWQLMDQDGLVPSGVLLCKVPDGSNGTNNLGGGEAPINPAGNPTITANGQPCPGPKGGVLPGSAGGGQLPNWYVATGQTQGPNVTLADACTPGSGNGLVGTTPATGPGIASPANTCYVFTDRGTFDYELTGATATPGPSSLSNLGILTRNNSATAPGGANELINYFHAYIINPAKSPTPVNTTAAQDFVNFITSPTVQAQLSSYLSNTGDPGGAPFKAAASPAITASFPTTPVAGGQQTTVTGTVTNPQPGLAAPANQTVTVNQVVGGVPVPVATGTTNASGGYSVTFTPPSSGTYQVSTGTISLIEPFAVTPAYGDLLSPGASASSQLTVAAAASIGKVTTTAGGVSVAGSILPTAPDATATALLLARPQSSNGAFKAVGSESLTKGQAAYAVNGTLKGGKWTIAVQYADPGNLTAATTATMNVTVPANTVSASFGRVKLKQGKLTLSGKLSQAPTQTSATVKLLALSIGKVKVKVTTTKTKPTKKKGTKKTKKSVQLIADAAKKGGPIFKQVAKTTVKTGKTTYSLKHTFARGHRYVLVLQYSHRGQTTTRSKFKYLNVN